VLCTGRSIVTRIDKIDRWIFEKNYAIQWFRRFLLPPANHCSSSSCHHDVCTGLLSPPLPPIALPWHDRVLPELRRGDRSRGPWSSGETIPHPRRPLFHSPLLPPLSSPTPASSATAIFSNSDETPLPDLACGYPRQGPKLPGRTILTASAQPIRSMNPIRPQLHIRESVNANILQIRST
jgi:hypothetical protein